MKKSSILKLKLRTLCSASVDDYRSLVTYLDLHVGRLEPYSCFNFIDARRSFIRHFTYNELFSILEKRYNRVHHYFEDPLNSHLRNHRLYILKRIINSYVMLEFFPDGSVNTHRLSYIYNGINSVTYDSVVIKSYLRYVGII